MNHEVNLNLIHRYLAGECTVEEEQHIQKWMQADPANRRAVDTMHKIWDVPPRKELESDIQSAWIRLEEQIEQREQIFPDTGKSEQRGDSYRQLFPAKKSTYGSVWLNVAAVIALAFLLSLFLIQFRNSAPVTQPEIAMREVVAKRGHQAQLKFNDGTKVILNADSRIRFPERFDSGMREVYLEGEAYFDVAHKPGVKFIVQTRDARVKVLGTKFNVAARPEVQNVEVAVAEGKVSVQSNAEALMNGDSEVVLTGGQLTRVQKGSEPVSVEKVNVKDHLLWIYGGLHFDDVPFRQVLRDIERRFDVRISIADTQVLDISFTSTFRQGELDKILPVIAAFLKMEYRRDGSEIEFK